MQPLDAAQKPSPPNITTCDLWKQFWADVFGKEVQDATTYSYTWLADQVGHVCLGLTANFVATLITKRCLGFPASLQSCKRPVRTAAASDRQRA